jgi:dTDP-4-amino-4,6-dideoxygalactose transaminase
MSERTRSLQQIRADFLPYALPLIGEEEIAEVVDTLRSGWLTTGPKTRAFEEAVAEFVGAPHAVAVNSNTAGLHISLAAHDIGQGDEVIVPSLTFCATANVVHHLGARPVLVEVRDDFNIDPEAVAAAVTPRTKAIMPVHYAGQPADLDDLQAIADRHGLIVLEDAAHAIGVAYRGRQIGTISRTATFSFYATKNLTTGEGGMVACADEALAARLRRLALHGMSRDAWKRYSATGSWYYEVLEAGFKYNMTDLQASIGLHQLKRLPAFNARRLAIADRYDAAFRTLPLELPIRHADRDQNFHLYVIRLRPEALRIERAAFIDRLREHGIGTSVHYVPVHMHPFYAERYGYRPDDLPRTRALYEQMISLPLYPRMTDTDVEDVITAVAAICEETAA